MDHNERIDNLIGVRVRRLLLSRSIEPSVNFTARVMKGVAKIERRHQSKRDVWVLTLALFPIAFRELWTLTRGDYISLSRFPFGSKLTPAYGVLMSEVGISILLALGVVVFVGYLLRFRRTSTVFKKA